MPIQLDPAGDFLNRLRVDFPFFVQALWKEIGLDKKDPFDAADIDMLRWMAGPHMEGGGPPKRGVLAPRYKGKSTRAAALCLWHWYRDPNFLIELISKTGGPQGHAAKSVQFLRRCLDEVFFLRHLRPGPGNLDSQLAFTVNGATIARNPSITAFGIESQITGTHVHLAIPDDVETPENTETPAARMKLREKVRELRAISSFGHKEILYLGTIHHPAETLYLKIAKEEPDFAFRTYPVSTDLTDSRGSPLEFIGLAPIVSEGLASGKLVPGEPVFPSTWDRMAIETELKVGGDTWFLTQFMLAVNVASIIPYPLKLRDLIVWPCPADSAPTAIHWGQVNANGASTALDTSNHAGFTGDALHGPIHFTKEWMPYTGCVMAVDPSGSGQNQTGYAIVANLGGTLFLKAAGGLKGDSGSGYDLQVRQRLCDLARVHRVRDVIVEENFGGETFAALLESEFRDHAKRYASEEWSCAVTTIRANKQKELRICDTLEPLLKSHRIVCDTEVAMSHPFQYQLTHMNRQRGAITDAAGGDDIIDAVAMACAQFNVELSRTPDSVDERERTIREWQARAKKEGRQRRGNFITAV